MHRLTAAPGGWTPGLDGVIFLDQQPAPIVILTAADTDIQTLARAASAQPPSFPAVRVASLLQLQQQLTIDTYAEAVLQQARVIAVRLLGGVAYWPYGLEVVKQSAAACGAQLIVIPGDDRPDPHLMSHSTVPLAIADRLWRYFTEGGLANLTHALQYLADIGLETRYSPPPPQSVPRVGPYAWTRLELDPPDLDTLNLDVDAVAQSAADVTDQATERSADLPALGTGAAKTGAAEVGVLFYRAHYLSDNTAPIDALCTALARRQLIPKPLFVSSLREPDVQSQVAQHMAQVQVILNTTSFAIAQLDGAAGPSLWHHLDVPVLQVILSGGTEDQWRQQWQGLSPRDTAMNVALPEVDGRIISRAISFKAIAATSQRLETDVITYQPVSDRVQFVADLAARWVRLRQVSCSERRVALILANYPNRDGRLANGVGLDTPESCVRVLAALRQAGYDVADGPESGDALMQQLTGGPTNDPEMRELKPLQQGLALGNYWDYFRGLPEAVQQGVTARWQRRLTTAVDDQIPIFGCQYGNVFVGIQPSRGYDVDPSLSYHAPDLAPTHDYLAFYQWVRQGFDAHAVVHLGKHGNLEWLPGKSMALSQDCYPEAAFGPLPHLYPFIVNDPGEGSQAKRRAQAVIIDHLTPPLTRAELYGPLLQLEATVDEYYEAQSLDPGRLPTIRARLMALVRQTSFDTDLGGSPKPMGADIDPMGADIDIEEATTKESITEAAPAGVATAQPDVEAFIAQADGYLCELKEAQIRDGLHIFGQPPQGDQQRDLAVAIARYSGDALGGAQRGGGRLGLTRAIATAWDLGLDPLTDELGAPLEAQHPKLPTCRTTGDAVAVIEAEASRLVAALITGLPPEALTADPDLVRELTWIRQQLLPALGQTRQEITALLHGLAGGYVPSGPSGAPTRGRSEVLPTGRNFYSVDSRAIPTPSAWDIGRRAAETLVDQYTQEHGEYPKTLGLSVWGTSTMRTGGDDIAEALALLGVQPVWDGASRRVVDFEILPIGVLGRPRVDVTLRISGFFRDAFSGTIDLFHRAVEAVAALEELPQDNPLAAQVTADAARWQAAGLTPRQAETRSQYRVFGSKPGAYGAGLQGLIEGQNWRDADDLARAYINWSSYAYTGREGKAAPEAFQQRLQQMQVVLHNQDNREHDLLDSDDYYQFQGGLTAAVRAQGGNPTVYFGDNAMPERPRVRHLREEIARVYRSRVVNPKWIQGVMRHGYKGAFEMAATVDYLFAYDATTGCVADHMYDGVAEAYLLDETVQAFVQAKNPWALRDMAERLLEAHQRQLWQTTPERVEALRAIAHQSEGAIEDQTNPISQ
ncbi:MAG: cobaltochelatase subunit CobN [Elainellaceae cyanobacterium]